MAARRALMTVNNDYVQPIRSGLNRRIVFSMSADYHSILLSKKFRKGDPRLVEILAQIKDNLQYCEFLDLTKADE